MRGKINKFESFATLEGGGIRYGIFMQGCPMRCVYCHNPETWAIDNAPIEMDAAALFAKVLRYRPYFGKTGGVTVTGGEPLLQAEFLNEFFDLLKEKHIHTALDTGASIINEAVERLIAKTDLLIADLKFATQADYVRYARGGSLRAFCDCLRAAEKAGVEVWVRTVIVPGINDQIEDIDAYLKILKEFEGVKRYELLGFHTMGFSKYDERAIDNPLAGTAALGAERLKQLQEHVDKNLF